MKAYCDMIDMKQITVLVFLMIFSWGNILGKNPIRLKVMTYNLRFGELATLKELADFISEQNPDVVALQELDCMTKRKRTPHQHNKNFITELGYYTKMFPLYGKTISYAGGLYGVGLLTKYPYCNVYKIMLPKQEKQHEARALLMAEVELSTGDTIIVASTHLDYNSSVSRIKQLEVITTILEKQPYPVVLGGDFNAKPDSEEINLSFKDWCQLSRNDVLTSPAQRPKSKIDYLFGYPKESWNLITSKTVNVLMSDHLPIISEIELFIN